MDCSIRSARPEDVEVMHNIRLAVRENPLNAASGITAESYARYVANRSAWVAERNNAILGFAAVDEATASVWALFVAQQAEGAGVGRRLHDAILAWARGREIAHLRLATAPNTRAEGFYAKLGWRLVGYDEHGQLRFDRSLDRQRRPTTR